MRKFGNGSPATLFGTTVQAFFVARTPKNAAQKRVQELVNKQ